MKCKAYLQKRAAPRRQYVQWPPDLRGVPYEIRQPLPMRCAEPEQVGRGLPGVWKRKEKIIMNEKPILFSVEMVRAILDGRKTQTRRPIKQLEQWMIDFDGKKYSYQDEYGDHHNVMMLCPYKIRDRLLVRESHSFTQCLNYSGDDVDYVTCHYAAGGSKTVYPPDERWGFEGGRKYSCMHMPRWASRITLEITGVRVERVQDITKADALAEGMDSDYPIADFSGTWDLIYEAKGIGWDTNPFVWVYEFKIMEMKK